MGPPKEVLADTQKWLHARFPGVVFKNLGNALSHGEQKDSISCIPATMNTISHGIFGDALWTHENRFLDRIVWFMRLVPDRTDDVSKIITKCLWAMTYCTIQASSPAVYAKPDLSNLLNYSKPNSSSTKHNSTPSDLPDSTTSRSSAPKLSDLLNAQEETVYDDLMGEFCDVWSEDVEQFQEVLERAEASNMDVDEPLTDVASGSVIPTNPIEPKLNSAWSSLFGGHPMKVNQKSSKKSSKKRATSPTGDEESVKRQKSAGTSKAAISERKARSDTVAGIFDPTKRDKWKKEIRAVVTRLAPSLRIEPTFNDKALLDVHCPNCDQDRKVQKQYDVKRFEVHFESCVRKRYDRQKTKVSTSRTLKLTSETIPRKWDIFVNRITLPNGKPKPRPCSGISEDDHPQIPTYLRRSAASGGGARNVTAISMDLFSSPYRDLVHSQQQDVLFTQLQEHRWRNDHQNLRIFSTECSRISPTLDRAHRARPCDKCASLLELKVFKNILRKKMPADTNYRYNNAIYRNDALSEHFAKCAGLKDLFDSVVCF